MEDDKKKRKMTQKIQMKNDQIKQNGKRPKKIKMEDAKKMKWKMTKKNCETHYRGEELLFLEHINSYIVARC